jgi:hypothetical protein
VYTGVVEIGREFTEIQPRVWASKDEILKKREGSLFDAWDLRMRILSELKDSRQLLLAAHCRYHKEGRALWIRSRRYDRPGSPALMLDSPKAIEDNFKRSLPDVLATEALLRTWPGEALPQIEGRVAEARAVSDKTTRALTRALGAEPAHPLPPETPLFLSHGDVLVKNIILTAKGYRLIDWETLSFYPASSTLAHAFAWTLAEIPDARWSALLDSTLPDCLEQMMLSEEGARLAIFWQMVREALFWKPGDRRLGYIKRAEKIFA